MSIIVKQQNDNALVLDKAKFLLTMGAAFLSIDFPFEVDLKADSRFFTATFEIGIVPEATTLIPENHPMARKFGLNEDQLRAIAVDVVVTGTKIEDDSWVCSVADYLFTCSDREIANKFSQERGALIQNILSNNIKFTLMD